MATLERFMLLQVREYDYFLQYVIIFCPVVLFFLNYLFSLKLPTLCF